MRDMQRERLTHLLANAILELWKKETGSLSSVIIEGTICITSGTGKTTVLQVADRFNGSIPEAEHEDVGQAFSPVELASGGRFPHHNLGLMRSLSMPHYNDLGPRVDCHSQASMAAFLDNLSPASLVSPGTDHSRSSRESRSPSAVVPGRGDTSSMDVSTGSFKDDILSESGSDSVCEDKTGSPTGGICPGTGYYTCATPELNNNNIEKKIGHVPERDYKSPNSSPDRLKRRRSFDHSPDPEFSNKKRTSLESLQSVTEAGEAMYPKEDGCDAMDLTRKDGDDLALSPPQSYTAQVRDVIRQRLLAAQKHGIAASTGDDSLPTDLSKDTSDKTLKALKSLGLQPSENETSNDKLDHETLDCHVQETQPRETDVHDMDHDARDRNSKAADRRAGHEVLRVNIPHAHAVPPHSRAMLSSPISPIMSTSAGMKSVHASLASIPRPNMAVGNGPLHAILRRKPFMTPPLRSSMTTSSPSSAPPMFSHPGFSPLAIPHQPLRDASLSPTDLSLDNSSDDKEVGPNGEQRVYRCEFCTKTFLFKSKYHEHLPVHTNARPFQCHLCSRTYKYKYDLRVHLRTHMGIPTKSTVCPFCNTKFDTNKMLRVHIKDSHRDKQKVTEDDCTQAQETLTPAV